MSQEITISVITICFNNHDDLLTTIGSVDKQTLLPFEHIIIDGSTTTEIRDYLNNNPQPSYRRWISERDTGIADAFNKGVRMAGGRVLNMLNSGDKYFDETILQTVADAFSSQTDLSWLHGKFMLQRGGIWVTIGKPFDPALLYRGMRSLSHQSMFVKAALHEKYGLYDITLRNAMDYDFVCRIAQEKFLFIEKPLIVFAPGGTTDRDYLKAMEEGKKVYSRNFGSSWKLTAWQFRLKVLHHILRSPLGKFLYHVKVYLKLENA